MTDRNSLTAERLRELLDYNPETGVFTRRKKRGNRRAGSVAGCLCRTNGYVVIGVDYGQYHASVLAVLYVTGAWPTAEVDHRDRDRANNRWRNLRPAMHAENARNRKSSLPNTSGFRGVFLVRRTGRWLAKLVVGGKQMYFGTYDSAVDAAHAHDAGARMHHGAFAYLNFPESHLESPAPPEQP